MLREQIQSALKEALKAGKSKELATLRLISAALKDKDIAVRSKGVLETIGDDEILAMLQTMIKQRQESVRLYREGGRDELAAAEEEEIGIIRKFLPEQMDDAAMISAIAEVIAGTGAVSVKDMGKVMGVLKERYTGRMDFAQASVKVKEALLNK